MKKIVTLTVLTAIVWIGSIFAVPAASYTAAAAEPIWGRVLNKTTYLYNSPDNTSPCFLIPETYYVNIISETGDYFLVRYQTEPRSVLGYIKKSDLYICDYVPENPYLNYEVKAKPGAKGYLSSNTEGLHDYIFNSGNKLYYYGRFETGGTTYYYVSAFDLYRYYIKASECETVVFEYNRDPLPLPEGGTDTEIPTPTPTPSPSPMGNKTKLLLVIILVVPALVATAYLFKPAKKPEKQTKYFYDETDYE